MLKILINNEEVVCDKQLEIKEEMLSTSSCILNNCYPKSWENTKDYTRQYYYPKDYSKCVIYDEKPLLPKEYTQVDYIQSSGTQYIDSGILPSENIGFEIDFTPHNDMNRTTARTIFGSRTTWKSNGYQLTTYTEGSLNGGHFLFGTNNTASLIRHSAYMQKDVRCQISFLNGVFKSANGNETNIQGTFSNVNKNIYLFGCIENRPFELSTTTLYRLKFYDNNVLVRDFIPCYRNSDNVVGLYDLVNNTFYTNQGTGLFTYGQMQETITTKLLFSGVVKNTGNINLNPRYPHYCSLEVLDFKTFLSECEQLDFVINNKTVSEAIEQVVQAVASYGFVVGNININDDTIIGAYSTQEKTPYDVFQYLADISQSRWYTRLVDENTVAIDFYDPTEMQRGVDLDFSNNEFACENNVEDLSFNYGTYDYRNKQIMLSNQVFGGVDFEETIVADGYNKIFNTTTPIGILKGITVNGSSATFATNEDKEMGVEADFYYNPGQTQIESNENDGTYPANTIIVVGYTPLVKGRQVISDTTEINRIATQTGRNGTISRYEKRNDVLSSDELELIGNSYLKYKGTPEINLTVVTKDIDLYDIGQIVYFNYPNIEDLSQDYMVKSKRTKIINTATDWNIWYTYTLTSNFNSENAINYFDNQRAKSTGNIQAGDYITRNVDIENSCMIIFSNPTATEITIADNNILNAPLNAPFTQ